MRGQKDTGPACATCGTDTYYASNGACVVCAKTKHAAWRNKNNKRWSDITRKAAKRLRAKDPDKYRQKRWTSLGLAPPPRPRPETCELCHQASEKVLVYDHCHTTNAFRGWLCNSCNTGLGMFRDDPALMRHAALYIERKGAC